MNIEILQRDARQIAYIRVTGPYEQALPAGFDRLCDWAKVHQKMEGE